METTKVEPTFNPHVQGKLVNKLTNSTKKQPSSLVKRGNNTY